MINLKSRTRNILLSIGALIILFLLWYFSAIVTYILIALVLSFIGRPLVRWLNKVHFRRFTIPRTLSAFITLLILWVVFLGFFRFMIPLLIKEFTILASIDFDSVFAQLQEPLSRIIRFANKESVTIDNQTFFEIIIDQVGEKLNMSGISNTLGFLVGFLGDAVITFFAVSFITFFFLKDEGMFREGILLLVPSEFEEKTGNILNSVSKLLRRYFTGLMFEVFMVGLLVTLGLNIAGLAFQHAVVIGLFAGLFNVIPYLGPWIGALVGLTIAAAVNINMNFTEYTLPLLGYMVLVFMIVQLIDNILFQPLIYSSSVKAHPLEIFLVILAAGSMAGILGMILAIPVYTILRVIAREFFENMKLVKQLTKNMDKK
jgi:predicted PurR-regulated permease PerM